MYDPENDKVSITDAENDFESNLIPDDRDNLSDLIQLQQKIKELEANLLAAEEKAASNWDLLLRARAEEENNKKRFSVNLENAHKYAVEKFAKGILGVVDSLELGINSSNHTPGDLSELGVVSSIREGMELTLKLLLSTLDDFGIKMVDPIGEVFNPIHHEAIGMHSQEGASANTIIKVVQKGFTIHDRVLRPARVIVAN